MCPVKPEGQARQQIDAQLARAGWTTDSRRVIDEFGLKHSSPALHDPSTPYRAVNEYADYVLLDRYHESLDRHGQDPHGHRNSTNCSAWLNLSPLDDWIRHEHGSTQRHSTQREGKSRMSERLFISGVQKELAEERQAVRDYVRGDPLLRRFFEVFLFEDLPASDRRADEVYLDEVDRSGLYVGLFGNEYGSVAGVTKSPTEQEFDRATAGTSPGSSSSKVPTTRPEIRA